MKTLKMNESHLDSLGIVLFVYHFVAVNKCCMCIEIDMENDKLFHL